MASASTEREKAWRKKAYREGRKELIKEMGGKCEECGNSNRAVLEFHHIQPRTWIASSFNQIQRLRKYREDLANGVLVLLCSTCNKRAGQPIGDYDETQDFPF